MDILLATILSCEEAKGITDKVKSDPVRIELIEVLKMSTEKGCFETQKPTKGTD